MKDINTEIFEFMKNHEACLPNLNKIPNASPSELLDLYIGSPDFCFETEFITNDMFDKYFKKELYTSKGIYVNDNISIRPDLRRIFLLGNSDAWLFASDYRAYRIYCKDKSNLEIDAVDHAHVVIDLYGKSSISINALEESSITVYLYEDSFIKHSQSSGNAKIKVVRK